MSLNLYIPDDELKVKQLLLGRKIVKVENNTLFLDNGIQLLVSGNIGCAGCGSGDYNITELNGCDNAITNVEFVVDDGEQTSYKIFVLAEDKRIKILQADGDDGNGFYGTGYDIYVSFPNTEIEQSTLEQIELAEWSASLFG